MMGISDARVMGAAWGVGRPFVDQHLLDEPPIAEASLMFLPAAIVLAGKSSEGESWKDWERTTLNYPPPLGCGLSWQNFIAEERRREPKAPLPLSIASQGEWDEHRKLRTAYEEAKLGWEQDEVQRKADFRGEIADEVAYVEAWKKGHKAHANGVAALSKSLRQICQKVADRELTPFGRPFAGGETSELKRELFMLDVPPISLIRSGTLLVNNASMYVFIPQNQLSLTLALPAQTQAGEFDGAHLTSFLKVMLDVSTRCQIGVSGPVKHEALKAEVIVSAARFGLSVGKGGDLTDRDVTAMAKFLRAR